MVFFNGRDAITLAPIDVDFYLTYDKEIQVAYGGTLMLDCGGSDHTTPPGCWYHNGEPLGVNSTIYTIINATFDDDGEYQCIRNGSDVFSSPLQVDVYGLLNFTTLNCNSKSTDGTCVINAQRGQPVTLCISQFTTPSIIPQGKHVIGVNESSWSKDSIQICRCINERCEKNVSNSCLTVSIEEEITIHVLIINYNKIGAIELPSRGEKFHVAYYEEIRIGYGQTQTIYCGNSDHNTPPGDWLHDGKPLGVYSRSYTINSATFDDDGEYQCRRNGNNVFLSTLEVYGTILNSAPLNCNSISQGACVINVKRGQPVTLCTTITTTPAVIPPGKHVVSFHTSHWNKYSTVVVANETIRYTRCLYKCLNGSCHQCSTHFNYTRYSNVNDSCLTIKNVLEKEKSHSFGLFQLIATGDHILQNPSAPGFFIEFFVTELNETSTTATPATTSTPEVLVAIAVSTSIITIVIVILIISLSIVFSTIVRRYKQSSCAITSLSSEVGIPLQESYSSRPTNLIVYRMKDVKRLEKIGRGSFWKVYKGKLLDNRCAIKRLRGIKESTNREGLILKVLKELDMWSSLNHPNIVRLYGTYHQEDDDIGIPLLIVELMDRNLTDQLQATSDPTNRNSLLPLQTKLAILIQVAGALEYLHTHKNVVHGDLTANNVLLKESPAGSFTAKLTDFGMSRVLNERDNIMSTDQGTYSYMPPEVHNAGQASTKVDIYSFGVLCVHLLCHKFPKPLYALTVDPAGAHIVVSEFQRYRPYLFDLSHDEMLLEPLIEECLQYDPENRLHPEEVIGQLNSIQGRLRLKETGPASDTQTSTVVHQHFIGPVVSGCTITESNLNVTSIADSNMQVSTAAEITPLTGPFEPVPAITSRADLPDVYHPSNAKLED